MTIEKHSATWIAVEAWANEQLKRARESNDSPLKDATQTALLRGRIKALKDLKELVDPKRRKSIDVVD